MQRSSLAFQNNEYKSLKLDIMNRGEYRMFSVFVAPGSFGSHLSVRFFVLESNDFSGLFTL